MNKAYIASVSAVALTLILAGAALAAAPTAKDQPTTISAPSATAGQADLAPQLISAPEQGNAPANFFYQRVGTMNGAPKSGYVQVGRGMMRRDGQNVLYRRGGNDFNRPAGQRYENRSGRGGMILCAIAATVTLLLSWTLMVMGIILLYRFLRKKPQ